MVALWPLVYLAEEGVMDNEEFTGRFTVSYFLIFGLTQGEEVSQGSSFSVQSSVAECKTFIKWTTSSAAGSYLSEFPARYVLNYVSGANYLPVSGYSE